MNEKRFVSSFGFVLFLLILTTVNCQSISREEVKEANDIANAALHVRLATEDGIFRIYANEKGRRGVVMKGKSSSYAVNDPADVLCKEFESMGWKRIIAYDADGPDGTAGAFRKNNTTCIYRLMWDGGDDMDPLDSASQTAEIRPDIEVEIDCYKGND
jgi:hypothetical protein